MHALSLIKNYIGKNSNLKITKFTDLGGERAVNFFLSSFFWKNLKVGRGCIYCECLVLTCFHYIINNNMELGRKSVYIIHHKLNKAVHCL